MFKTKRESSIFVILLSLLIITVVFLNFYRITLLGLNPGDGFGYLEAARQWTQGNYEYLRQGFYRPAAYLLHAVTVGLLGYNDYSIKIVHATFGIINAFLIYAITFQITGNRWYGLLVVLLYVFLPPVIIHSRREMVHIPVQTCVLLATLLYLRSKNLQRPARDFSIIASGLLLGLGANIHPSIIILGPCFVLFLVLSSFGSNGTAGEKARRSAYLSILFTIGFVAPYIIGVLYYGHSFVINAFLNEIGHQNKVIRMFGNKQESILKIPVTLSQYFYYSLTWLTSSKVSLYVVSLSSLVMLIQTARMRAEHIDAYLPMAILLFFSVTFVFLHGSFHPMYTRLFLHVAPFVFIHNLFWIDRALKSLTGRYTTAVVMALGIFLFSVYNFGTPGFLKEYYSTPNIYRWTYDILDGKVSERNRLLILPYIIYSNDRGFNSDLYFGGNATYIKGEKYTGESLDDLVRERDIKYVFWATKSYDQRYLMEEYAKTLPVDFYGLRKEDVSNYSVENEAGIVEDFYRRNNTLLVHDGKYGRIFEIRR